MKSPLVPQAFAQVKLGEQLQLESGSLSEKYQTPADLVNLLVGNLFIVAGFFIFGMLIAAGLSFLKDSDKGKDEAKTLVTGAVIGFIIMFAAYWIVQIIEAITGTDIPI